MKLPNGLRCRRAIGACALVALAGASSLYAQQPTARDADAQRQAHRVYKISPAEYLSPGQLKHPLVPALQTAYESIKYMHEEVSDYTCRLVARERINGTLGAHRFMDVKVRHQRLDDQQRVEPFGVYVRFLAPDSLKGREVLYVAGRDDGNLIARNGGNGNLQDVTMVLDPLSPRAMLGNRYPLTEIGIETLARRLIEVGYESLQEDLERRECEVKIRDGAKIDGRRCRVIQVEFPRRRDNVRFHLARIFIDEKLPVPIRYEAYGWPRTSGEPPVLLEEYTYLNLKLNVGLTDLEFRRDYADYHFFSAADGERKAATASR